MDQVYKNMNLLVSGESMHGKVDELVPPKLQIIKQAYRGGGQDVAIETDMGMEPLAAEFTMLNYNPIVWRSFGVTGGQKKQFAFRGALGDVNGLNAVRVEFLFTGSIFEIDPGTWKAGQESKPKFGIGSVDYFRYSRDGEVIHEIDVINAKRIVDGVDQLAQINAALGVGGNINLSSLTASPRSQSRRQAAEEAITALGF